jgi:DNA-binding response OmpR family regulator
MALNGHILIIDDEAALRQTLTRILQRTGLQLTSAASGQEGLNYIARQSFDLVYLDIRMPDMNGMEVLKIIHASHPELPVVLFTAQPDLSSALEALRQGATDYLLKPLKPNDIVERTRAILARRRMELRKQEIQEQIEALQAELHSLATDVSPPTQPISTSVSGERYLKRGKLILDLHTRHLTINGQETDLPPTAFDYLLVLVRHAPNVVDYQTLVAEAQGYQAEVREAQEVVKWHVHHIRQAIEPDLRRPCLLINVRGAGYRLVID